MAYYPQQVQNAVVVDIGTAFIKIGYAVDPCPTHYPSNYVHDTVPINPENLGELIARFLPPDTQSLALILLIPKYLNVQLIAQLVSVLVEKCYVLFIHPQHCALVWSTNRTSCAIADFGCKSVRVFSVIEGQVRKMQKLYWSLNTYQFKNQVVITDGGPALPGFYCADIPQAVVDAMKNAVNEVKQYYKQVDLIVTGGGSLVPGLDFRVQQLIPACYVICGRERQNHCWLGGAVAVGCYLQGLVGLTSDNWRECINRGNIWSEW